MCCSRLAANTGRKKLSKNRHLGTTSQLCQAMSSQLQHVSTIGKTFLSSNISSTCPHNMVNFGPLAAQILSLVWVSRLGSVTARHSSSRHQPNFSALNRGHHLYAAGRPSRWAFAHILVTVLFRVINPTNYLSGFDSYAMHSTV